MPVVAADNASVLPDLSSSSTGRMYRHLHPARVFLPRTQTTHNSQTTETSFCGRNATRQVLPESPGHTPAFPGGLCALSPARGIHLPSQEDSLHSLQPRAHTCLPRRTLHSLPFTLAPVSWSPGRTARSRPKEVKGRLLNKVGAGHGRDGREEGKGNLSVCEF